MEMRKLQLDLFFTGSLGSFRSTLFSSIHFTSLTTTSYQFSSFFFFFFGECVCWSEENGFWQLSENCLNFVHSFWVFASYFAMLLLASIGFWFCAFALWAFAVHGNAKPKRKEKKPENLLLSNAY